MHARAAIGAVATTSEVGPDQYPAAVTGITVVVCTEAMERLTSPLFIDGERSDSWVSSLIPSTTDHGSPVRLGAVG